MSLAAPGVFRNDGEPEGPKVTVEGKDVVDVEFGGENTGEVIDEWYPMVVVPFELLTCVSNCRRVRPNDVEARSLEDVPEMAFSGRVIDLVQEQRSEFREDEPRRV